MPGTNRTTECLLPEDFRFEVGMKLRVRNDLQLGRRYGTTGCSNTVMSSMTNQRGRVCIVQSVGTGGQCMLKENDYWWTKEMFERLVGRE